MHILLINPICDLIRIPQGLLYLGSAIKNAGYEVTIYDESLVADPDRSLAEILSYDVDVIGLSVYTTPKVLKRATLISRKLKAKDSSTILIWGGWHPTMYPRQCLKNKDVDIIVPGPGEKIVCELLNSLEHGYPLRMISGLILRGEDNSIKTVQISLDPDYLFPHLNFQLVKMKAYQQYHEMGTGILQYISSRGCIGKCRFCCMHFLFKGRFFRKPSELLISELDYLINHYAIKDIHFSDDNAFFNDKEASEFSDIINIINKGRNIRWRCAVRISVLSQISDNIYQMLRGSGCKGFIIGIESGVDRVLKLMRKGHKMSDTHAGLKKLINHKLSSNLFSFLVGFPGETEQEMLQTFDFARQVRISFPKSDLSINIYNPLVPDASSTSVITPQTTTETIDTIEQRSHLLKKYASILQYYLAISKEEETHTLTKWLTLKPIRQKLAMIRIKHNALWFPVECYFSKVWRLMRKQLMKLG